MTIERRSRDKLWQFGTGRKGARVAVYERESAGPLYARAWDATLGQGRGGWRRVSLGHRDRALAKRYAVEQAAKLEAGHSDLHQPRVTLARLFALYEQHRTPRKSPAEQQRDRTRIKFWTRVLGGSKDPHRITLGEWQRFLDLRSSGAIDAHGEAVPEEERRQPRCRVVEGDAKWLRFVCNWGTRWRLESGHYLLRENCLRGFEVPTEQNPKRAVATTDRYEALRAVSDQVRMGTGWGSGHGERCRSHLSELLDLANGTGRRISAILALRFDDLRLDMPPHGAIRWRAEEDKMGRETVAPIGPQVRAALDRIMTERPGLGAALLFPNPSNPAEPCPYERARVWLLKAETLAKLSKQDGSSFHAFRRGWATARKHLPAVDVAEAGGWKTTVTLQRCYQQPDHETMVSVVLGGAELRERRA